MHHRHVKSESRCFGGIIAKAFLELFPACPISILELTNSLKVDANAVVEIRDLFRNVILSHRGAAREEPW